MNQHFEIIQRYDARPWESIRGPFADKATATEWLAESVAPGDSNPRFRLVRAEGVEYRVVPEGERP